MENKEIIENKEITKSELIELYKIQQEDFFFRHKLYWDLFYKTIYAILGLLALPHALHEIINNQWLLSLFPFAGSFLSLFAHLLMGTENVRMVASKNLMNKIGIEISVNIKLSLEEDPDFKIKKKCIRKLLGCSATKKMNILYWILTGAGLFEGLMIGLGCLY